MVVLDFGWLFGGEYFWGRCGPYTAERAGAVMPRPSVLVVCFTSLGYLVSLKFAWWKVPSSSFSTNCRQVPAHALSVFQT